MEEGGREEEGEEWTALGGREARGEEGGENSIGSIEVRGMCSSMVLRLGEPAHLPPCNMWESAGAHKRGGLVIVTAHIVLAGFFRVKKAAEARSNVENLPSGAVPKTTLISLAALGSMLKPMLVLLRRKDDNKTKERGLYVPFINPVLAVLIPRQQWEDMVIAPAGQKSAPVGGINGGGGNLYPPFAPCLCDPSTGQSHWSSAGNSNSDGAIAVKLLSEPSSGNSNSDGAIAVTLLSEHREGALRETRPWCRGWCSSYLEKVATTLELQTMRWRSQRNDKGLAEMSQWDCKVVVSWEEASDKGLAREQDPHGYPSAERA
eukprot:1295933-Pyramimonas_sp.AAC.1